MLSRLKQLRQERNISQKKLALAIGITQQSINQYENQKVEPDIATLCSIADYFETSVDYLVGHTDVQQKIEPVAAYMLNENEAALLQSYRSMNARDRKCVNALLSAMTEEQEN